MFWFLMTAACRMPNRMFRYEVEGKSVDRRGVFACFNRKRL
jgi:hypothetical protein